MAEWPGTGGGGGSEGPRGPEGPAGPKGDAGAQGPKGEKGDKGEAGGGGGGSALTWEDLVLAPGVSVFGSPYAPKARVGYSADLAHLSGLILIEAKAFGDLLFTVPEPARPKYKKIVAMIDGNNPGAAGLMAVAIAPNGQGTAVAALGGGAIPSLDFASYALLN